MTAVEVFLGVFAALLLRDTLPHYQRMLRTTYGGYRNNPRTPFGIRHALWMQDHRRFMPRPVQRLVFGR